VARRAIAALGLVAEGEERLVAAGVGARMRDLEHLVGGQECALAAARRGGERAVVADVAAQLRQRDEDLRRVRDEQALAVRAQRVQAHVLVPLKRLNGAKSRLAAVLSPDERAALVRRMLGNVAGAVAGAGFERITLVTSETIEVDGLARFDDRGLPWNEALAAA